MNTAQVILEQIKTIDPRALFAWGAKDLINMGDGLKFKTSGMVRWKGYVHVKYNQGTDLYDIEFFRVRYMEKVTDETVTDIYAENLVEVIDRRVG